MIKFKQDWRPKKSLIRPLISDLEGVRVTLRVPVREDYAKWSLVRAKNQKFLEPYEPTWAEDCLTTHFFERRLVRQEKERTAGRGCYFLIHHHQTEDIIGGININNIQMGAACFGSLGYWIDEDFQGQGYMSEAGRLVIAHAFGVLKLKRLNAACLPENLRSIHLLKSLGFKEEGFAEKYLQINGAWQDHLLFGLIS